MKDSEFAGNAQRASQHYQLFLYSVSSGISSKNLINPNFDRNGQNIAPPPVQGLGV